MLRRPVAWFIAAALVAAAAGLLYQVGVLDLSASPFRRIGYGSSDRGLWSDKPFSIGHPGQHRDGEINFDFVKSHGVYLVRLHTTLVAVSVQNPATGKPTRYDAASDQFVDPSNGQRFEISGLARGLSREAQRLLEDVPAFKASLDAGKTPPRSLERCHIKRVGKPDDPDAYLQVDPRHRYLYELNQWSQQYSAYLLEESGS